MPNPFPWQPIQPPGEAAAPLVTRSQSALFARILLSGQVIGLAQSIRWEGQSGNGPITGIGEPHAENKPGMLYYTGTIANFAIRKRRLMDITIYGHPSLKAAGSVIDYRLIPFDLEVDYQQLNGAGTTTIEKSHEQLNGLWLQTWTTEFSDPTNVRMENLTFWAAGYTYQQDGAVVAQHGSQKTAKQHEIGSGQGATTSGQQQKGLGGG